MHGFGLRIELAEIFLRVGDFAGHGVVVGLEIAQFVEELRFFLFQDVELVLEAGPLRQQLIMIGQQRISVILEPLDLNVPLVTLSLQSVAISVKVAELKIPIPELGLGRINLILELGNIPKRDIMPLPKRIIIPSLLLTEHREPMLELPELVLQVVVVLLVAPEVSDLGLQLRDYDLLLVGLHAHRRVVPVHFIFGVYPDSNLGLIFFQPLNSGFMGWSFGSSRAM